MKFYLTLAWRNLFRNKRRTLITAASVFFAVFFALLMRSLQFGVYDNMIKNVVGFFTGYAQVHQNGYWAEKSLDNTLEYSDSLKNTLLQSPKIQELVPRLESFALASVGNKTKGVMVVGMDIEKEKLIIDVESKVVEGNYFKPNDDGIIVAKGLADYLKIGVNDTMVLLGQGYQGRSAAGKYPIRGITKISSPELNNNLTFLPLTSAQNLYAAENRLTSFIIISDNPKKLEKELPIINEKLSEEYEIMGWKQMLPELIQIIEADSAAGLITIGILYLIISFGMFGTVLMMTTERIYEFGVLISVGLKRWKLIIITLLESFMVNFVGVIAGIIVSIPVLIYFHNNPIWIGGDMADFTEKYDIEPVLHFSLDPEIFWTQALYVLIIAIIINWYPIYKISKLEVTQALRA